MNGALATTMETATGVDLGAAGPLVLRARAGDESARSELARSCARDAFSFALQLTRDREEASEVAQEATLRVFQALGRFDAERPVRPWLLTITRNLVRDRWRRRQRRPTVELEADLLVDPEEANDPERRYQKLERQRMVWRALAQLSEDAREIVVLRDYRDASYAEIAEVLGIPLGTVMSRLHRARARLAELVRAHLRPGGEDADV